MIANFISDFWYEQSRDLIASVTNRFGNRAISSFTYGNDAAGRRISIRKGGEAMGSLAGSVDAYGYNGRNEVVSSRRILNGSEVRGFSESFTYDPIGNRITATEHDETGAAHVSRYTANGLNQYVSRTVPGLASARGFADTNAFVTVNGNEAFRMGEYYFGSDQFDNSVQSGYAEVETYAALNCETNDLVSAVTNVAFLASSTESFIYDEDGNLVEDVRFRYFWNGENRMVRAEEKLAPPGREPYIVTCAYDHMGRNVMKDGARFVWDDYNIIVENLGASNETHNIWGLDLDGTMQGAGGVGGLLAVEKGGSIAFPAYDANGNITEYVNGSGEILSHNDYSAFGRELIKTGSDDFTHRFSTKPLCRKTGFIEYQLRKYKPWCGRWMNRDLIESRNLYNYLFNSSFLYYEYLGMFGNPVIGPGGTTWGPSSPYDPGGPFSPDVPWYDNLPDCPCSIPVDSSGCPDSNGAGDGWTSPVETGHAGGTWEIRSNPVASGAGQQCVYDSAGNLINIGPGSGTPDIKTPSPNKIWDDLRNFDYPNLSKTIDHIIADGWQFVFGTSFDHLTHPPNKGRDANGNPCPDNDGKANPPNKGGSGCCNN